MTNSLFVPKGFIHYLASHNSVVILFIIALSLLTAFISALSLSPNERKKEDAKTIFSLQKQIEELTRRTDELKSNNADHSAGCETDKKGPLAAGNSINSQDEHKELVTIEDIYNGMKERMQSELIYVSKRSRLNLIIGVYSTSISIAMLVYVSITSRPDGNSMEDLYHLFPFLSLTILLQVFTYFFLGLHKRNLSEIKYYQNEMTNVESRMMAIILSSKIREKETTSVLIRDLMATERNFVLNKGQTTVELERDKLDQKNLKIVIDALKK